MWLTTTNCNYFFWKLHRLCQGLWRQVWRADGQTRQMRPWLGPPGESAAARVPERYISSQFLAVHPACPSFDFLLPVWALPWCLGHSPSGADERLLSCVWVSAVPGWTEGCRAALAQLTPSPSKLRLKAKFSLYEPASMLDYFPLSVELCKPQVRNSLVLSTNKCSFLDSVVYIPISRKSQKPNAVLFPGLRGTYCCEILGAQ